MTSSAPALNLVLLEMRLWKPVVEDVWATPIAAINTLGAWVRVAVRAEVKVHIRIWVLEL